MKIFIAGICGTFMAGIAQLAKSANHEVSGCDSSVYPPMSTLLASQNVTVLDGYLAEHLDHHYHQVVIGNALSRGNPLIEAILNRNLRFQSGPQWLHDNLLIDKNVVAVAGTHGKTSTAAMVTWILHSCGIEAGYLIGGKPGNFKRSAEAGISKWFVIEADEYDTAFFDKRSKFVHYKPNIAVLNNLEFDHADIFSDLDQIKTQFHHLLRIVPANGYIVCNQDDLNIQQVLAQGCWSNIIPFSTTDPNCRWFAKATHSDCSEFDIFVDGKNFGSVTWDIIGRHNMQNALSAIAAAHCAGVDVVCACQALTDFISTERRLQLLFNHKQLYLYEDFAHHPTAIKFTIDAVKSRHPGHDIIAIIEPRSNTMRLGCHGDIGRSFDDADATFVYRSEKLKWCPEALQTKSGLWVCDSKDELITALELRTRDNSVIICMSNGSFDGIPMSLKERLQARLVENTP